MVSAVHGLTTCNISMDVWKLDEWLNWFVMKLWMLCLQDRFLSGLTEYVIGYIGLLNNAIPFRSFKASNPLEHFLHTCFVFVVGLTL
jgi:hypothetical protein